MATESSAASGGIAGFSRCISIEEKFDAQNIPPEQRARGFCRELEAGNILLFPESPIAIPAEERELLLGRKQTSSAYHKNIAYRPEEDRITGLDSSEQAEASELCRLLKNYSGRSVQFLTSLLTPYAGKWKLDYASFRPIEEKGRPARLHARNDLLHFDSFPTRPTNGARILRFFTNINPAQNRVWLTSETFAAFGPRFAKNAGVIPSAGSSVARAVRLLASKLGVPGAMKPPYDESMHRCHNAMKEDAAFQESTPKQRWEFPPNSSWMVFTDCVSHAVLEGRYALEQTFLIPQSALVEPNSSPLAILEGVAGRRLTV
jgi:hypothetical protein